MNKRLTNIYNNSKTLNIDNNKKIVIMSDCHRGNGDRNDNFKKNKKIYKEALKYYYYNDFTYVELGDGDEIWEESTIEEIKKEYYDIFKLIRKFYLENNFITIHGNHDMCKRNKEFVKKNLSKIKNPKTNNQEDLFPNLEVLESLTLKYENQELLLLHGHQVDFLNSNLWKVSRFLVRYVWKNLEYLGLKDPTKKAKNYSVKNIREKILENWSKENNVLIISGHTHRPVFPKAGKSTYFNDGSCIHPNGVTCIEIENGEMALVKWSCQNQIIKREYLSEKEAIKNFST